MTKETWQELLRTLDLEWEAKPSLIYLFYETPDGRVMNFSISIKRGHSMSDTRIEKLMRKEYPATREGKVLAVHRPEQSPKENRWVDIPEVCEMLHITRKTLYRWTKKGVFLPSCIEGRLYYDRSEIERALDSNIIMENGRLDTTVLSKEDVS